MVFWLRWPWKIDIYRTEGSVGVDPQINCYGVAVSRLILILHEKRLQEMWKSTNKRIFILQANLDNALLHLELERCCAGQLQAWPQRKPALSSTLGLLPFQAGSPAPHLQPPHLQVMSHQEEGSWQNASAKPWEHHLIIQSPLSTAISACKSANAHGWNASSCDKPGIPGSVSGGASPPAARSAGDSQSRTTSNKKAISNSYRQLL